MERKSKGDERETRWREGFGSPKHLAWRPHARPLAGLKGAKGVQRHPRRRKMRHRNHRGTKIKKLGTKFKFGQLIFRKMIKIVATG